MGAALAALGLSRWELEILGALLAAAAVLAWFGFHDAGIRKQARSDVVAQVKAVQDAASAVAAIKAARVDAEQEGNLHEANAQNARRKADALDVAAVVRGLRDDAVRPRAAAQGASVAGGGIAGSDPGADLVPGRLLDGAEAAFADTAGDAADLAVYARGLRTSGGLCGSDYGALGH